MHCTLNFHHFPLYFKNPSGTSRGIMTVKNSWLIKITAGTTTGTGEISIIEGLSPEFTNVSDFENKIDYFCKLLHQVLEAKLSHQKINEINLPLHTLIESEYTDLQQYPSILFGMETALLDLKNGGKGIIFDNDFANGKRKIPINGLVWMGDESFMKQQVDQKLAEGFTTIKLKIGAIDLEKELNILRAIRANYSKEQITLRVDANGAFTPKNAAVVLQQLAELAIHSIEQPIQAGQWEAMKNLCASSPTPIALDEELIGIVKPEQKIELLETILPHYIILKPSLHGGISGTQEWIRLAQERNIAWWMTSALESNIGLNAICQLTAEYNNVLPQGLGTGSLYTNNVESSLHVADGMIRLIVQ
jgi:O-succinylbenzoate synthase